MKRSLDVIRLLKACRALGTICLTLTLSLHLGAHVHVQGSFSEGQWRLYVYDFDAGEFDPGENPLLVGHRAHGFVPANALTNSLGVAGREVWILQETENPELLFLGVGTSGITPGFFVNNQVRLELRGIHGPGDFALYSFDVFGWPVVHMNSRDGVEAASDFLTLPSVNGHAHLNWAFNAPGIYRISFSFSGRLSSSGQITVSAVREFTFHVQDIPDRPRITGISPGNGTVEVTVRGVTGRPHRLWSSSHLQGWSSITNWTPTTETSAVNIRRVCSSNVFFRVSLEAAP